MTGARITITVDDAPTLVILRQLAALMDDMTPVMADIGDGMVSRITIDRFEKGRGPGGVPWKPSRRVLKTGGKTLIDRQHLQRSIVRQAGPRGVEVGSNGVAYAAIHQFGGQIEQRAYGRKVAFRQVAGTNKAGETITRSLFAIMKGSKAPKRVDLKVVEYPARTITMPARPYLGFDDDDREDVSAIITQAILRITRGGGVPA